MEKALATIGKNSINNIVSDYDKSKAQSKFVNRNFESDGVYYFPSGGNTGMTFSGSSLAQANAYIAFPFFKYVRPSVVEMPTLPSIGTIVLPIPNELKDSQSLAYTQNETNHVVGQVIGAYMAKQFNVDNFKQLLENELIYILKKAGDGIGNFFGGKNTGSIGLQVAGYAENPYLTMLFRNPVFRRFVMHWLFIPQSKKESDDLNYILNKLKYHALPGISQYGNTQYNYPDMCKPILIPSGYQFDFKHCVLENVTIDYVPGNTPAFQASSRAPVAIKLAISLLEIELWTKEDLQKPSNLAYDNNNGVSVPQFTNTTGYLN